ncbi:MAG: outer membrane beta-barrel protein, partial [Bacteroidia bacterium]
MKKYSLAIIFLLITLVTNAQNQQLTGRVLDETGKSLSGARVILQNSQQIAKETVTDTMGKFTFSLVSKGKYTLTISSLGFDTYHTLVAEIKTLPDIRLKLALSQLKEVALTYTRPAVEQRAGKTVVNVAGSINATGTSAFEILQKSPGVNVDEAGTVRMSGKTGVQVMIDGKIQPLNGDELASLLKSIPANMIDKIELNTNPSSKYDAGGNAGIIDIRTNRERRVGTYGNISGSLIQATYGKATSGMNLNFRKGKWNFSTNYNYTYRKDFASLQMNREFFDDEEPSGALKQENVFQIPVNIHNAQASIGYTLPKGTTVELSGSFYTNDNTRFLDNRMFVYDAANTFTGYNLTNAKSDYHRRNPATTFSLKQKLGTAGLLSADVDYAYYSTQNNQTNQTTYFRPDNTVAKSPYTLFGDLTGEVTIRTAKADYTQPLKGWLSKMEAGWKSSWVKSDNDVAFFDRSNNNNEPINAISNHFIYNENINVAYMS